LLALAGYNVGLSSGFVWLQLLDHPTHWSVVCAYCAAPLLATTISSYFLPTIVAQARRQPNLLAIGFLNLLLGWSFFGWVGALVWALVKTDTLLKTDTPARSLPVGHTSQIPDDGRIVACVQCGRRVARGFLCSDGRCQRCYVPSWGS
jgi:hypothetical protein